MCGQMVEFGKGSALKITPVFSDLHLHLVEYVEEVARIAGLPGAIAIF